MIFHKQPPRHEALSCGVQRVTTIDRNPLRLQTRFERGPSPKKAPSIDGNDGVGTKTIFYTPLTGLPVRNRKSRYVEWEDGLAGCACVASESLLSVLCTSTTRPSQDKLLPVVGFSAP